VSTGGLYVYALTTGEVDDAVLGTGVDGLPLRVVRAGPVSAIVHDHEGGPFAGPEAEVRRRVLEHDAVVERVWAARRAVLPMTFDVIVEGREQDGAEARLERWLRAAADDIDERLHAVRGAVELRVDVTLDQHAAAAGDPEVTAVREELERATPGIQRLLRKRLARLERDVAERLADELYPEVRARLARLSVDLVENRRAPAGEGETVVLSAALLAPEHATTRLGEELAALDAEQEAVRVRFLGPWPPYSFAALRPVGVTTVPS
jgi:hypothetical protein